eukprot:1177176-Prorocentrum_minimum.AAC.2
MILLFKKIRVGPPVSPPFSVAIPRVGQVAAESFCDNAPALMNNTASFQIMHSDFIRIPTTALTLFGRRLDLLYLDRTSICFSRLTPVPPTARPLVTPVAEAELAVVGDLATRGGEFEGDDRKLDRSLQGQASRNRDAAVRMIMAAESNPRSANQSCEGREDIPALRTNRVRGGRIFPQCEPIA